MKKCSRPLLVGAVLLSAAVTAHAQAPAAAPAAGNIVNNGDFQKFTPKDNLWDGIDSGGSVAGWSQNTYAIREDGRIGGLEMPVSVTAGDINGDGIQDLVTCDSAGILRAYINAGTKTEPKFTFGEVIPLFLPQVAKDNAWNHGFWTNPQSMPKVALYDWNKRGSLDLIVGNYAGDILLVPNTGGGQSPAYAQPVQYDKIRVQTSNKRPWGNLFAPCPVDWNKDGKTDLLVGEGSYSANSVFVLINQSSSDKPVFVEEQRFYLCYGDGREQLVPTVADYNGDGLPDVLVGDRLGRVGVYLNPGNWKPGTELKLATDIRFGASEKLGAGIAPHAVDMNGDGLFDLVIGKSNGKVVMALNKGTKTEPKFDAPVEIKGVDTITEKLNVAQNWNTNPGYKGPNDPGVYRGNLYAHISVSPTETSPDGGKVLVSGYYPSPNKVFKMVPLSNSGKDYTDYFHYENEEWKPRLAEWSQGRPTEAFVIRQQLSSLKKGATYTLKFKVKGMSIEEGVCTVAYLGVAENVATKFKKNEGRGVKADKDETHEEVLVQENITASKDWKAMEKTFTVGFKESALKKPTVTDTTLTILEFKFNLPPYTGVCEISDVSLVMKK